MNIKTRSIVKFHGPYLRAIPSEVAKLQIVEYSNYLGDFTSEAISSASSVGSLGNGGATTGRQPSSAMARIKRIGFPGLFFFPYDKRHRSPMKTIRSSLTACSNQKHLLRLVESIKIQNLLEVNTCM